MNAGLLLLLAIACLSGTVMRTASAAPVNAVYWWRFNGTDCAYDDVTTADCKDKSVDDCKAICLKTSGCGGFNTHGFLKKTSCINKMSQSPTVDLYVIQDQPQPQPLSTSVPIWPVPQHYSNGSQTFLVDADSFKVSGSSNTDLDNAVARYRSLMFPHKQAAPTGATIAMLTINVKDGSAPLQFGASENYTLSISQNTGPITITADTNYGAYHALETLSQLITFNFDTQHYEIQLSPWAITDYPRFPHREILWDSARHFEPVATLKGVIDSLTYAKVNVIHWHLVDSQSFPFISPSHPELAKYGAWLPSERYTVNDVAEVVEYARARGVRVYVEIDTPGHAASWCKGQPEICPSTTCLEPLNPATNKTFDVIADLFKDLTGGATGKGLFPDNMMHLGGDEVNTACWTSTPAVAQWMAKNNFTADQTYEYFVKRVQAIANAYGREVIGWEEIWDHFGTSLRNTTIIHQWLPGSTIAQEATKAGYRVLWSTDGVWYLDGLGVKWEDMYTAEPCMGIEDHLCNTLVLGGGGCMWGETVDTSDIQQTIWPRMAAIAERLWSPRGYTDTDNARPRFEAFRCLLNRRGIAAAPSNNANARSAPPGPGACTQ